MSVIKIERASSGPYISDIFCRGALRSYIVGRDRAGPPKRKRIVDTLSPFPPSPPHPPPHLTTFYFPPYSNPDPSYRPRGVPRHGRDH
jgi:hypothetical protein